MRSLAWSICVLAGCGGTPPMGLGDAGVPDAGSVSPDAGTMMDAGTSPDGGAVTHRCDISTDAVHCPMSTLAVPIGGGLTRDVNYALPGGTAPDGGWPVAVMFQGSFSPSQGFFDGTRDASFGLYYQVLAVAQLLDEGVAVVAPEAHAAGNGYWDTNIPPWDLAWDGAPDDVLMKALFDAIDSAQLGPLSADRWYAGGISSGGFMTSRMAVSYPGRFRALAIASGGYATCGATCLLPSQMPAGHPPTLFLHGAMDPLVPVADMLAYRDALADAGVAVQAIVNPALGHEWLPEAPDAIRDWFAAH
jgi:predicted esterase